MDKVENKSKLKLNKVALIIAVVHWVISFATDRLIFNYSLFDFSDFVAIAKTEMAWGAKVVFLGLLIALWQLVFWTIEKVREKDKKVCEYLKCVAIYFLLMSAFFVILSPGLWRLDEFGILKNATYILPHFWQGYLTSVFYIFALMLIPNITGVVIVQYTVISFIVGYIVMKLKCQMTKQKWWWTLYIPFLAFPVIDSNFYPIRMSVYAFLEILLIFELILIKYENRTITKKSIWGLSILTAIVVCWRTEAIYYIVAIPVVFAVMFYKDYGKKIVLGFTLLTVTLSTVVTSVQFLGNRVDSGNEYDITAIVLPITPLAAKADEMGDNELLEQIDKVLETDILVQGYKDGRSGISLFWDTSLSLVKSDYTDEEYKEFKGAYYQLIKKYPDVFFKERWNTFINSTGILSETQKLFTDETYAEYREMYGIKNESIFRASLIKILELIDCDVLHNIIYSFVVQFLVLAIITLILLIKGKWGYGLAIGSICAKVPLIFLTAPSMLFMYYYSVYLAGTVMIVVMIIFFIDKKTACER